MNAKTAFVADIYVRDGEARFYVDSNGRHLPSYVLEIPNSRRNRTTLYTNSKRFPVVWEINLRVVAAGLVFSQCELKVRKFDLTDPSGVSVPRTMVPAGILQFAAGAAASVHCSPCPSITEHIQAGEDFLGRSPFWQGTAGDHSTLV